jgi:hypothetical protein
VPGAYCSCFTEDGGGAFWGNLKESVHIGGEYRDVEPRFYYGTVVVHFESILKRESYQRPARSSHNGWWLHDLGQQGDSRFTMTKVGCADYRDAHSSTHEEAHAGPSTVTPICQRVAGIVL